MVPNAFWGLGFGGSVITPRASASRPGRPPSASTFCHKGQTSMVWTAHQMRRRTQNKIEARQPAHMGQYLMRWQASRSICLRLRDGRTLKPSSGPFEPLVSLRSIEM